MGKEKVTVSPMTRIEGHLDIQGEVDREAGEYTDAQSSGTMFRGFEVILKDREPADAIWLTQRVCGVCPVPHAVASAEAVDMAYQASPPPLATALRDFVHAAEELYDAPLTFILRTPDYSRSILKEINPNLLEEAQGEGAERSDMHGYEEIGSIMKALDPEEGKEWLRSLEFVRGGKKMASIFGGKHPHVNTFVPGGISTEVSIDALEKFASLLSQQIAYSKEFVPLMDDLCDFLADMGYDGIGVRPSNLLSYGAYDDPIVYDARYENMAEWGEKRKVTPGVVIDGELATTNLTEINLGVREFVTHSYYEEWEGVDLPEDPLGNEVPEEHPWNKKTIPKPGSVEDSEGKYSWVTAPRWHDWKGKVDGGVHALEAGPLARMWTTAVAEKVPESTGSGLKFTLPSTQMADARVPEEISLEWDVPDQVNTLERLRCQAYFHAYSCYVAYNLVSDALDMIRGGERQVWNSYERPDEGIGVGLTEAYRGALGHWVIMEDGKIKRYQMITPSTWNSSPRDKEGRPGPYEEAITGTPITEPLEESLEGIDVVRCVRSFDPCLGCGVHLFDGDNIVHRDLEHFR